jgi:gluconate 2-dehydrogenase gamma chain
MSKPSDSSDTMDRRDFLKSMAASGTVAVASLPVLGATMQHPLAPGCKFFTVPQAALIEAVAEQMVPADESPGGKAAGVVFFIDGVLAGRYGKFYRDRYEAGLSMINAASQKQFGNIFVSISREQQTAVLKALQLPDAAGLEFFGLLLRHVMEGYYGDPEHGGNRDGASWKMIGFEG